jgi:hypothetical protein
MKTKVLWRPHARDDLLDIYVAVGLDNPSIAGWNRDGTAPAFASMDFSLSSRRTGFADLE